MTRWVDLDRTTRSWITAIIIIVLALIILAWFGYFSGGLENQPTGN